MVTLPSDNPVETNKFVLKTPQKINPVFESVESFMGM